MINSRKIADLNPETAALCRQFVAKCIEQSIDIIITSTYRDFESQDELYKQGRVTPGPIVTNAKPGFSYHNFKVAFDFAPIQNGKIDWNNTHLFHRCGEIAESVGLEWAGRWRRFPELAHCQYTGGLTLAEFRRRGVQVA